MNVQRTLILVKPDAFARGLTGEILARFERKGLKIAALRSLDRRDGSSPSATTPSTPSGRSSASSSTSSPPARWWRWCSKATRAIAAARQVIGATNPLEAAPGQHPRRLRPADRGEHGPRLGLGRPRPSARPRCSSRTSPSPLAGRRPLVLASGSPERRAILERGGRALQRARPPEVTERQQGEAVALTLANALAKARAVQRPGRGRDGARLRHGRHARRRRLRQAGRPAGRRG